VIRGNNIRCNGPTRLLVGLLVVAGSYSGGPLSLDATLNFWGSAAGPVFPPNNTIVDPDSVVRFTPFLTSSASLPPPLNGCPSTICDGAASDCDEELAACLAAQAVCQARVRSLLAQNAILATQNAIFLGCARSRSQRSVARLCRRRVRNKQEEQEEGLFCGKR
jgi:hypothetical protein